MILIRKKILCDNNNWFFNSLSDICLIISSCFNFYHLLIVLALITIANQFYLEYLQLFLVVMMHRAKNHNYYNNLLLFLEYIVQTVRIIFVVNTFLYRPSPLLVANVVVYVLVVFQ